jgi:hypothetical protein
MYGWADVDPDPMSVFALAEAGTSSRANAAARLSFFDVIFGAPPFVTGAAPG